MLHKDFVTLFQLKPKNIARAMLTPMGSGTMVSTALSGDLQIKSTVVGEITKDSVAQWRMHKNRLTQGCTTSKYKIIKMMFVKSI